MSNRKTIIVIISLCIITFAFVVPAFAVEPPNIVVGLDQISAEALANKILKIALGVGALSGVIAAAVLIYLGFKLKTGTEKTRSETKDHIVWVFAGMGLVGFAVVIVGFAAYLIKGA